MISVSALTKHYGEVKAVDGVDLHIDQGEVFALLGPNGAGKTTTVEILEGHRSRTAGEVSVLGVDPESAGREFREQIGIVLQGTAIEKELTVREAIDTYGSFYPRRRPSDELMEIVGISHKADARIKTLSGGQQRRLELALGIVGDPELIFLDEPTTGFDPAARRRSWALVESMTALGRTVVLTTHYLDEAEQLADRVIVLARGTVVAEGTPSQLRASAHEETRISFALPAVDEPIGGLLEAVQGQVGGRGRSIEIVTRTATADLAHLTGWATARGIELEGLVVDSPDLEDVYLRLIGEEEIDSH